MTRVDRFLTPITIDFTQEETAQSELYIMTPGGFVGEIRELVVGGL